jgi:hypothetical protein
LGFSAKIRQPFLADHLIFNFVAFLTCGVMTNKIRLSSSNIKKQKQVIVSNLKNILQDLLLASKLAEQQSTKSSSK